jgi:uncharacterized protein YbbC (DUF1343 family)
MRRAEASSFTHSLILLAVLAIGLAGFSGCGTPPAKPTAPPPAPLPVVPPPTPPRENLPRVMLGIDVLEAEGFAAVKGKRIGLLTHPAGVNRRGVQTVEVLRRAPGVQLVALYAVEHGIYGELPAEKPFNDFVDPRTRLPVYSLYKGNLVKPSAAQLKGIDALVIDLQDIGTRSYTFTSAMKIAMESCFENGKEVIILDRPNPLGGLKVDGPPMDAEWMSDVGRFRVPYVHGLTMGELAYMVRDAQPPGGLRISEAARTRGKLTVIPMRGWTRSMRWTETDLTWVPTSPAIQDWAAVQGYPMTGLVGLVGGFSHGVGKEYPFRGIAHPRIVKVPDTVLEKELRALNLPGIRFRPVSVPGDKPGTTRTGLYIEIPDYDAWEPTALNFHVMKLACKLEPKNPFARVSDNQRRTFLVHVGSAAFFNDIVKKGKAVDIDAWLRTWREQAKIYQEQSKKFWLYR